MYLGRGGETMASAFNVANLFLSWANKYGDLISNLKIHKLLYYAQAWHLVNFDTPLFKDKLKAWEFGPVVPEVYRTFKKFNSSPIQYKETGKEENVFEDEELEFLKLLYEKFIGIAAYQLVNMSHNEEPWKKAYKTTNRVITHKSMKEYYSRLINT